MSVWEWGTVEKIQQKLEKVLILSNIRNFEKKISGIFGKSLRKFWKFLRDLGKLWIKFV